VLTPNEANDELTIDLHGDLAGILSVAEGAAEYLSPKRVGMSAEKVAGAAGVSSDYRGGTVKLVGPVVVLSAL
jgi:hypothetical protein